MYAVIMTGGKQYRVAEGDTLKIELLPTDAGQPIVFDKVLMVTKGDDVKVGKPYLDGATVSAGVVKHGRGKKIQMIKFRRRKHSMSKLGHRQGFTEVKIDKITA
jgi:large subunit ribosomal protein L21